MRAHCLGVIPTGTIDAANTDALTLEVNGYTAAYEEFAVGSWASAPLWSDSSGQASGEVREHSEPARPIPSIVSLVGINNLISSYFNVTELRCARLFRASHGAIVLPHRDYMEHSHGFTRLHVPLITDPSQARNTEEDRCFHMRRGEVWYLDARRTHSGGVLGAALRVHLVLDFSHSTAPAAAVAGSLAAPPGPLVIDRPPLPRELIASYEALAPFVDGAAWRELLHILARVHLRYCVGAEDVYHWLEDIAANSRIDRELLLADARRMKKYYISDGPSTTETFESMWSRYYAEVPLRTIGGDLS
jgi:hypothetical protein